MATDATLLSVGIESSGIKEGTQDLKEFEGQARKTEDAVEKLGAAQGQTKMRASEWVEQQKAAKAALNEATNANDSWLESQARAALALGRTRTEIIAEEGALRNLNATQMEQLQAIVAYRNEYEKMQQSMAAGSQSIGGSIGGMLGFATAIDVVRRGIDLMISVVKSAVLAFVDFQDAQVRLQAMLTVTNNAAGRTVEQITAMAKAIRESTTFDDTSIIRAATSLTRFGSLSGDVFDRALNLSANLATVMGTDITQAAEMVGRAMENSYGTMMLRRIGMLTDAQVEYLRAIKDVRGDQEYINELLAMLEKRAGDAAKEVGKEGLGNAWKEFANQVKDSLVDIGKATENFFSLEAVIRALTKAMRDAKNDESLQATLKAWASLNPITAAQYAAQATAPKPAPEPRPARDTGIIPLQSDAQWLAAQNEQAHARERETEGYRQQTEAMKGTEAAAKALGNAYLSSLPVHERIAKATADFNAQLEKGEPMFMKEVARYASVDAARNAYIASQVHETASRKASNVEQERAVDLYNRLFDSLGQYTQRERDIAEIDRQIEVIRKANLGLSEQELKWLKDQLVAKRDSVEASKLQAQADKEMEAARAREVSQIESSTKSTQGKIDAMKRHIVELKGGKAALVEYDEEVVKATIADLEWQKTWTRWTEGEDSPVVKVLQEAIDKWREWLKVRSEEGTAEADAASTAAALKKQKEIQSEWEKTAKSIDDELTEALLRGFESGKGFAENFRDTLKHMFATLILRPIIQFIFGGISGLATGALQALLGGGSGGIGNVLQAGSGAANIFSGGSNFMSGVSNLTSGNPLNFLTGGGFGVPSAFSSFAFSSFGQGLGLSTAMGPPTAAGAMSMGLTPFGTALGGALPFIGGALAIASLLGAFDREPSEVKGRFRIAAPGTTTGFEDNAYTSAGKYGNLGFSDADTMYFSGAAAQSFNKIVKEAIDAFDARFSKEQSDKFAEVLQQMTFDAFEGTYTTEDFIKKYGSGVLKQVVGAAFDILNPAMAALMRNFSGTAEEITTFTNNLLVLYDAMTGNPAEDAQKAWDEAQKGVVQTLDTQREDLQKLIDSYDGSAEATATLAQATNDYRVALVNLLLQIKAVEAAVHQMFQDTIRSMTMQTLNPKEQYNYLRDEVKQMYAEAMKSSDPARIQELMTRIGQDMQQAFNLLTPAQQKQMLGQYRDSMNTMDAAIRAHLESIASAATNKATETFGKIQAALDAVAEKLDAAATKMSSAGDKMVRAADTPTTLRLVDANGNEIGG